MKRLIVITLPHRLPHEEQLITALFEAGLERLHLRKPDYSRQETEALIRLIPACYHDRLVLHDHHELVLDYALGGVHLNSRNPQAPADYTGAISCSCHRFSELKQQAPHCSYLFLSPLFPSISKQGYGSGFTLEQLRQAAAEGIINQQVIALGGIDTGRIRQLRELPFGGYALLGALWGEQPTANKIIHNFNLIKESL